MRRKLAAVVLVSFFATGCTGSFNLTRKVYDLHRSQDDKWSDELFFLVVALLPIYGFATFADAFVFNSIEFWTDENPIDMSNREKKTRVVRHGDEEILITYDPATQQIQVSSITEEGKSSPLLLERSGSMVLAKNEKGELLYSSKRNTTGDIVVYDKDNRLLENIPADQVESVKKQHSHL
jgi:hypothetical protein